MTAETDCSRAAIGLALDMTFINYLKVVGIYFGLIGIYLGLVEDKVSFLMIALHSLVIN